VEQGRRVTVDAAALVLQVVVFPGLVFTAVVGLIISWIDRMVTARVQMRVGPPPLQPFYDLIKLMIKETCVPAGAPKGLFLAAPLLGLAGVSLAATIIWRSMMFQEPGFTGDIIVLVYLLTLPALGVILGSFASRNPLASLGGSREMKLLLAYELPLILTIVVVIVHAGGIRVAEVLAAPPAVTKVSGILAFLVAILCMQAKLTLVPFDSPEAETELSGGAYIEYSGPPLAMFKLTRTMMLVAMPMFLVTLFCGGIPFVSGVPPAVLGVLKYVGLVVVIVLIRNTAPRVRIDQAVKFFWGPMTAVGLVAVVLALLGL